MPMRILARPGNLLLLVIVILPVAVAAILGSVYTTPDAGPMLNLLGRLAGVMGMTMVLVAAAVSIRIPGFDQPFGGLTSLWKMHHWLGGGAFLLAMVHPILLALSAATLSPQAASAMLLPPFSATAVWIGWGALLAMTAFLAPTFSFFGTPHYQRWKRLHAVSALAVMLAFAHTVMLGRDLPEWVWWTLALIAAVALSFRLVWRKLKPGQRFRIDEVTPLADRVVELTLSPLGGKPLTFAAGQFVYLTPLDESLEAGRGEEHPYTIASAPQDAALRIAIKDLGDASRALQHVQPGTLATVDGPYGRFFEPDNDAPQLWIGGGIGITPFVGRARWMRAADSRADVHLVYCANDPGRAYYLDVFSALAEESPNFHVWPHFFRDEGPLLASWITARCTDIERRFVYACGPGPMLDLVESINRELGIPASRYNSEEFDFL